MFCRLCIIDNSEDFKNLFNEDGAQNEVYQIATKYFEKELQDAGRTAAANDQKCSRVICMDCWRHISEFHGFQEMVLVAQKQYEHLLRFEEFGGQDVKVEVTTDAGIHPHMFDIMYNTAIDESLDQKEDLGIDPFEVTGQKDVLEELESISFDEFGGASELSSDDDKPLLSRIVKQKKRGVKRKAVTIKSHGTKQKKNHPAKEGINVQRERKRLQKTHEFDEFIAEHWKRDLSCGQCDHVCGNFSHVGAHFRQVHNVKRAYVVCCQQKYYHRLHLVEHLNVHLNPEIYKCAECGKCSTNSRNLQSHMKSVHPPKKLERIHECEVCHKRYAKVCVLRAHMDLHATGSKDFVCPHCNKGFVLESRLNIHVRNVHSTSSVCDQCGKSFRSPYTLRAHLLEQHEGVEKRKWPCDQCDSKLNSKYSLKRHKRVAHHDGSTAYVCSECGKVALTPEALRSHKKYVHQKERKYKCTICSKAFKVAVVLKEHMTTHTGQDLYQCPHCPRTFKVNANMHHHRKRKHPKEWAEKRQHRNLAAHSDLSHIANEIVM